MRSDPGGKNLNRRIDALVAALTFLKREPESWKNVRDKAYQQNRWFIPHYVDKALAGIVSMAGDRDSLSSWVEGYDIDHVSPKNIGIIAAGNIPMVGFHDLLCAYLSGHNVQIKLSEKDNLLLPFLVNIIAENDPGIAGQVSFVDKLKNFDAVIATGSNNTARYFESYFGSYPNLIRKNRNSVGILSGQETREKLLLLGEDIFTYFGLGCRNVSKLYVPEGYDFTMLLGILDEFDWHVEYDKYKNNFDYNLTIYLLNRIPHLANNCLVLLEDKALLSRIACLHFEEYENWDSINGLLSPHFTEIQCIVSEKKIPGIQNIPMGKAQNPGLTDYADNVDTMKFLTEL